MGTFSSARLEYDDPAVPATFDKGTTRKAFLKGFMMSIWKDHGVYRRYRTDSLQAAFVAGWNEARRQRRDRGEQVAD